jgi:hypothetical protein
MLGLAECQERVGNKKEAVRWYTSSKRFFKDQEILKEIDARINLLNK